jgi:DNA-binding response OmpR family regulator
MSIKKRQILVVDDEPDVNLTIKLALENEGFEVDTFDKPNIFDGSSQFCRHQNNTPSCFKYVILLYSSCI